MEHPPGVGALPCGTDGRARYSEATASPRPDLVTTQARHFGSGDSTSRARIGDAQRILGLESEDGSNVIDGSNVATIPEEEPVP